MRWPTRWVTENSAEHSRLYAKRFRRLATEHRFATWDLRPWRSESPFSVSVLRR